MPNLGRILILKKVNITDNSSNREAQRPHQHQSNICHNSNQLAAAVRIKDRLSRLRNKIEFGILNFLRISSIFFQIIIFQLKEKWPITGIMSSWLKLDWWFLGRRFFKHSTIFSLFSNYLPFEGEMAQLF